MSSHYKKQTVPISDAMVAWNPTRNIYQRGGEPGQIGVCKHPDKGQLRHLAWWFKAKDEKDTLKDAKLKLMIEAWHIACRDGVSLSAIHDALSNIPEYLDMLSCDFIVAEK
jgi:hypothetical protein